MKKNVLKIFSISLFVLIALCVVYFTVSYIYIDQRAREEIAEKIDPATINMQDDQLTTWDSVPELLKSGKVASVMQSHSLKVTLVMKDGVNRMSTTAPKIDAIMEEINKCGDVCKDIIVGTE